MNQRTINAATGLFDGTFGFGMFLKDGKPVPVLVRANGGCADLSELFLDTHQILEDWDRNFDTLVEIDAADRTDFSYGDLPVTKALDHPNLMCAGANYKQHSAEMLTKNKFNQHNRKPGESDEDFFKRNYALMEERARTGVPFVWTGLHSSIVGPNDDVILPVIGDEPDWEMELGVVVGKSQRYASVEEAEEMIAGYVAVNDLGTVDIFRRGDIPWGYDWISKHQPSFKPVGPFIVPRQLFPLTDDIRIKLTVNDKVMQDWPVTDMIFGPAKMIAYLSERVNLMPGDLIVTGSPPGNGKHHGQFLQDGDVMTGSITGLGMQTNICRQETVPDRGLAIGMWKEPEDA